MWISNPFFSTFKISNHIFITSNNSVQFSKQDCFKEKNLDWTHNSSKMNCIRRKELLIQPIIIKASQGARGNFFHLEEENYAVKLQPQGAKCQEEKINLAWDPNRELTHRLLISKIANTSVHFMNVKNVSCTYSNVVIPENLKSKVNWTAKGTKECAIGESSDKWCLYHPCQMFGWETTVLLTQPELFLLKNHKLCPSLMTWKWICQLLWLEAHLSYSSLGFQEYFFQWASGARVYQSSLVKTENKQKSRKKYCFSVSMVVVNNHVHNTTIIYSRFNNITVLNQIHHKQHCTVNKSSLIFKFHIQWPLHCFHPSCSESIYWLMSELLITLCRSFLFHLRLWERQCKTG